MVFTLSRTRRFSSAASICGTPDNRNIFSFFGLFGRRILFARTAAKIKFSRLGATDYFLWISECVSRHLQISSNLPVPANTIALFVSMKCQTTKNVFLVKLYKCVDIWYELEIRKYETSLECFPASLCASFFCRIWTSNW